MMNKISIVIPTFNESKNIIPLVESIKQALDKISYEIIFVDDSIDHTPEVLKSVSEKHSNVQYIHRENEKGLSSAVIKGFEMAQFEYIAVMDADLQHPPIVLKHMYLALNSGADICIPSRFIPGGSDGGLNFYRRFVSWSARYIGKITLKSLREVTDPTSGLFMFKRQVIQAANLQPIGWKIMIEVLALGQYSSIIETPYSFQSRNAGESKLSTKVTFEYLYQLFSLLKRSNKNKIIVKKWSQKFLDEQMNEFENSVK